MLQQGGGPVESITFFDVWNIIHNYWVVSFLCCQGSWIDKKLSYYIWHYLLGLQYAVSLHQC